MKLHGYVTSACLASSVLLGCTGDLFGGDSNEDSVGGDAASREGEEQDGEGAGELGPDGRPLGAYPSTPLARLTNDEYIASIRSLLELPDSAVLPNSVLDSLPREPSDQGVVNNANNQPISQLHIAAYDRIATAAAGLFLEGVADNDALAARLGCTELGDGGISPCLVAFGEQLLDRASREAKTEGRRQAIESALEAVIQSLSDAGLNSTDLESRMLQVRTLISLVALSPEFLLIVETGNEEGDSNPLAATEVANRLAFLLSGSPPDEEMAGAAESGAILEPDVRAAVVDRLLSSPEGQELFVRTLVDWLQVQRTSVEEADFDALTAFVSRWLADDAPFGDFYEAPVEVEHVDGSKSDEPLGILGSRAFLAAHTNYPTPSFITRGVFVVERLLCTELPDGIPVDAFDVEPMTPVEVFDNHAQQPCASCHRYFDNYGAVFQQFEPENNRFERDRAPFGDDFELLELGDVEGRAGTVADLGSKLAASEKAASCMSRVMYRLAMRRSLDHLGADEPSVERQTRNWLDGGGTLKGLIRTIVSSREFATFYR